MGHAKSQFSAKGDDMFNFSSKSIIKEKLSEHRDNSDMKINTWVVLEI